MKITLNQLAKHYGITLSSVKKWSIEKRLARLADMHAGVQPHITDLVAELAGACYRASCHTGKSVKSDVFYHSDADYQMLNVYTFDDNFKVIPIINNEQLSTVILCAAIAKVKELCHG